MVSVVIIVESERRDFNNYVKTLDRILIQSDLTYEFLIVANGTGKFIKSHLLDIQEINDRLRVFDFRVRCSKSDCIKEIIKIARGEWLLFSGTQPMITENSLSKLINYVDTSADVVITWRRRQAEHFRNQFYSRMFNWVVGRLTKNNFHDISCPLKLCRKAVLDEIDFFGDVLRFLPIFAAAKGYKIKEVPVEGSMVKTQKRHFLKPTEYLMRSIEIFAVFFNTRFSRKPLRFFSAFGALTSSAGLILLLVLFVQRFIFDISIGNRPSLFVSLLMMILGVLVSSAGLLGEIIVFFNSRSRKEYSIEKIIP